MPIQMSTDGNLHYWTKDFSSFVDFRSFPGIVPSPNAPPPAWHVSVLRLVIVVAIIWAIKEKSYKPLLLIVIGLFSSAYIIRDYETRKVIHDLTGNEFDTTSAYTAQESRRSSIPYRDNRQYDSNHTVYTQPRPSDNLRHSTASNADDSDRRSRLPTQNEVPQPHVYPPVNANVPADAFPDLYDQTSTGPRTYLSVYGV